MPLLDHFHPPLSERRPWESFHTTWCSTLADHLNRDVLPAEYIALEQVSPGPAIEIDVATFADTEATAASRVGGTATVPRVVWTPAAAPMVWPADFPDRYAVEIHATEGGRSLVAAIELVSLGNKDRASKRRLFAAKCVSYLARGVGLVVIDIVSSRHGNLHNEMMDLLGQDASFRLPAPPSLYTISYRPVSRPTGGPDRNLARDADARPTAAGGAAVAGGRLLPRPGPRGSLPGRMHPSPRRRRPRLSNVPEAIVGVTQAVSLLSGETQTPTAPAAASARRARAPSARSLR